VSETTQDRRERFADEISERTGVDVPAEYVEIEDDSAVLTDEGADLIATERQTEPVYQPAIDAVQMEATTFRALSGYVFFAVVGAYAAFELVGGRYSAAVGPAGIALLALSLARYYHTAEAV